jgi:hypothetical protein
MFITDPNFFQYRIPDPTTTKGTVTEKGLSQLTKEFKCKKDPRSGIRKKTYLGSGSGARGSNKHRVLDPDPHHCLQQ